MCFIMKLVSVIEIADFELFHALSKKLFLGFALGNSHLKTSRDIFKMIFYEISKNSIMTKIRVADFLT